MKKKYLIYSKIKLNILRGLLFGFLLLLLLSLSSTCFALSSDEESIKSRIDQNISWFQQNISSEFIAQEYLITKTGGTYYLYLDRTSLSYNDNLIINNGGGYRISLFSSGTPSKETWSGYHEDRFVPVPIYASNVNNTPQTDILNNYFFMYHEPEPDPEPELFDGVILSYDNGIEPVGTITPDAVNLKYHYDINTTYSGPNIHGTIYVYLEELSPGEALQQTPYSINNPTEENGFVQLAKSTSNYPYRYSVKYRDLLPYMKNGYIYRLQIGFVQRNISGDSNSLNNIVYTDICTSEFFSKDNWYSDKIIVKNIFKLVGDNTSYSGENGVVILESGDSGDKVIQGISDIQNSLVDLNKNITGSIESTILGTPNESGDRQGGLIGGLLDGIKGFFIPSDDFFSTYFSELNDWFSDRFGLLYLPFEFIISFLTRIYSAEFSDVIFTIPTINMPNSPYWDSNTPLIQGTTFNLTEFKNSDSNLTTIYNLYLVVIDGLIVWGLIQLIKKKYEEVMQ